MNSQFSELFEATHWNGNIWIDYLFALPSKSEPLQLFLGPEYRLNLNLIDWQGLNGWTFLFAHNFSVAGAAQYQMGDRHQFNVRLSIPLFSNVVRPPYNGFNESFSERENSALKLITVGDLMSLNKYQAFDFSLNYNYQLTSFLDLKLGYELHYQRIVTDHKWILGQHQFLVGTTFKF